MKDYEATWRMYWKDLLTNEDGSPNMESIKQELHDYAFMLHEVPKVYCELTNGLLSYPNHYAKVIIEVHDNHYIKKRYAKADILEILQGKVDAETLKEVEEYFD